MVVYHNCHIYGIWMSREVGELCFKVFVWNGKASQKSEDYVILLLRTLWSYWLR